MEAYPNPVLDGIFSESLCRKALSYISMIAFFSFEFQKIFVPYKTATHSKARLFYWILKMKILLFAHIEPTGGTGTFFSRLIQFLDKPDNN